MRLEILLIPDIFTLVFLGCLNTSDWRYCQYQITLPSCFLGVWIQETGDTVNTKYLYLDVFGVFGHKILLILLIPDNFTLMFWGCLDTRNWRYCQYQISLP